MQWTVNHNLSICKACEPTLINLLCCHSPVELGDVENYTTPMLVLSAVTEDCWTHRADPRVRDRSWCQRTGTEGPPGAQSKCADGHVTIGYSPRTAIADYATHRIRTCQAYYWLIGVPSRAYKRAKLTENARRTPVRLWLFIYTMMYSQCDPLGLSPVRSTVDDRRYVDTWRRGGVARGGSPWSCRISNQTLT